MECSRAAQMHLAGRVFETPALKQRLKIEHSKNIREKSLACHEKSEKSIL
jgi:hypothetical protein